MIDEFLKRMTSMQITLTRLEERVLNLETVWNTWIKTGEKEELEDVK